MKFQYIELLKKQIKKMGDEDFDPEVWKMGAIAIIRRIFGTNDPKAQLLNELKIDYSSWMLRDSNSNYKPIETAKLKGKEILTAAIEEIEIFGVPISHSVDVLGEKYSKELSEMSDEKRTKHFNRMKKEKLVEILTKLTSQGFR